MGLFTYFDHSGIGPLYGTAQWISRWYETENCEAHDKLSGHYCWHLGWFWEDVVGGLNIPGSATYWDSILIYGVFTDCNVTLECHYCIQPCWSGSKAMIKAIAIPSRGLRPYLYLVVHKFGCRLAWFRLWVIPVGGIMYIYKAFSYGNLHKLHEAEDSSLFFHCFGEKNNNPSLFETKCTSVILWPFYSSHTDHLFRRQHRENEKADEVQQSPKDGALGCTA